MQQVDTCINCGRVSDGALQKFCPNCGQPTPARRIDWHFLAHELEHSILHMDRGLLHTLKSLVIRPGHLIGEYLQGQRASYVKPFLLLLIMMSLLVVLDKYVMDYTLFHVPELADMGHENSRAVAQRAYEHKMQQWINLNMSPLTLLLMPLQAATFRLAFRSWRDINYPEWLVVSAFLAAQSALIMLLLLVVKPWLPYAILWLTLVMIVAGTLSLVQLFARRSCWAVILRSLSGYALYYLLSSVMISTAIQGGALWMATRHAAGG